MIVQETIQPQANLFKKQTRYVPEDTSVTTDKTQALKLKARSDIRASKDIEDDLTDTKIIVQWLAYAVVDIYNVLTQEQKDSMAYGNNIALFASMLQDPNNKLRVDVEPDQLAKIQKVFMDELEFAQIVKTEYIDKK